jgi:hypothetical protein
VSPFRGLLMIDSLSKLLIGNGLEPDRFVPSGPDEASYLAELPVKGLLALWANLAKGSKETKYFPIIRGVANHIYEAPDHDPVAILAAAPPGGIREVLEPLFHERRRSLNEMMPEFANAKDMDQLAKEADSSGIYSFIGSQKKADAAWPIDKPAPERFGLHTLKGLKGKPVTMQLIRVEKSYEVPAYLGFGGWNECPPPEIQVAILREWRKEYDAVPIAVTGDVLECAVPSPRRPRTEDECMKLAAEQWIFCDDIVGQGTQSVRGLAIEICKAPTWFFWWD